MESEPMIIREKSFPKSWEDFLDKTHVDHELMTQLVKGYLTSEGFHDISQIMDEEAKEIGFAEKNESSEPTELQIIQRSIREAILGGHIKRAESLINKNFPEMLDDDHLLHFYLQTLHLVELIRAKNFTEAIKFAQEDIVEKGDHPECLPDLERAMGLLAYEKPEESPFGDLLKQGFRLKVWTKVNQSIHTHEQKDTSNRLSNTMKYALWNEKLFSSLKIPFTNL